MSPLFCLFYSTSFCSSLLLLTNIDEIKHRVYIFSYVEKYHQGGAKMPKIKCSVNNCFYWDKGNICGADAIEVAKNFAGSFDIEAGTIGEETGNSNETKCVTFKPKKK